MIEVRVTLYEYGVGLLLGCVCDSVVLFKHDNKDNGPVWLVDLLLV